MNKWSPIGRRLERFGTGSVLLFVFVLMTGLAAAAFFFTSDMNKGNSVSENVSFLRDPVWLNLLVLAGSLAFFFFLTPRLAQFQTKQLKRFMVCWVLAVGLLWVFSSLSYPSFDSRMVTQAGEGAARGDYTKLQTEYFQHFPFQLGYVFYTELLMRLLPVKDFYLHIEALNVVLLAVGYLGLAKVAELIFKDERIVRLTLVLSVLCLPPILFSTFLYGTIPGLCCGIWAVAFTAEYLKKGGIKPALSAALLVALAVFLKQNYMIVLVAVCIVLFLHFLSKPKWMHLGTIALMLALVFSLQGLVTWQYEKRADVAFGDGIPLVSWAAMGLNEGYTTSGWYNVKYTEQNYEQAGGDADAAAAASKQEIENRIEKMKNDPAYTAGFFQKKVLSQWNEPTYQGLWTNQVRGHYNNGPWGIAALVNDGAGEQAVKGYMNFYQQLIFFCTAVALWRCLRKKELGMALFPLILLGGFLYHLVFEGKSQYIIPYFIMMLPLAACGLQMILDKLDLFAAKRGKTVTFSPATEDKEVTTIH